MAVRRAAARGSNMARNDSTSESTLSPASRGRAGERAPH
ncbi:Uncharacterised protein [Bordetella pertussis]|nr:Uncharacterised protein [Bordetella pertussis]